MKKTLFVLSLIALNYGLSSAQTTHNLDIIFQRGTPDTSVTIWGAAISGLSDVNGDGYDDVGVVGYDSALGARVYLFGGGPAFDTIPEWITDDATAGPGTGLALCGGDINGDGNSDVILETAGKVYVYYGRAGWPNANYDLRFLGRLYEGATSLAVGDLNGDDTTDLVVGDFWNMNGDGHVNIYLGSAVFDTLPWVVIKGHGGEEFGYSISAAGDINNDGFDDLSVGAINYGADCRGRLYVFCGGNPMDTVPDMWKDGEGSNQSWGWMNVATLPNGKGYGKAGIGCCLWPNGFMSNNRGKVLIFDGGAIMDSLPDAAIFGQNDSSFLGYWNAWVGDVDTNKYGDWGSLASNDSFGILWRCSITTDTIADAWLKYINPGLLANAGDVNGDGRDEVIFASNAFTDRQVVICKYTGPDGVEEQAIGDKLQIQELKLLQNKPNPFSHHTTIKYQIAKPGMVSLKVYNIAGQLVRTLVSETKKAGGYEVRWNGRDDKGQIAANGVYVYKLSANGSNIVKKMTLIR